MHIQVEGPFGNVMPGFYLVDGLETANRAASIFSINKAHWANVLLGDLLAVHVRESIQQRLFVSVHTLVFGGTSLLGGQAIATQQ